MDMDIKKLKYCRRLAVIGGTFDPIHYGHLAAAEAVRHAYQPELVFFIPAGQPPHKPNAHVTPSEHRYQMTLLATAEHPCFEVSPLELEREGLSYTVDTLQALREICPAETEIIFIVGADSVGEIATWKDVKTLLSLCRVVAVNRPGWENAQALQAMEALREQYAGQLHWLEMPGVAVSGTTLRERVTAGRPIKYLVPPPVERYIRENGLYASAKQIIPDFENIKSLLRERLSEARYRHTLGVVIEAERLAKHYGADIEKARMAGLLHDCAKEYGANKKRALCLLYRIALDEATEAQIDLTHSWLGAEVAQWEYGVEDPEILQAIRRHTTGSRGMSLLDKVVMLADFIEPYREDYPGLSAIRALAYKDMDEALCEGIRETIAVNKKRGRLIHPDSQDTLNDLKRKRGNHSGKHKR